MSKFKETLKSPHIYISLVTGISIIALAYFSKRILPRPISYLANATPPFIMTIYEAVLSKHKGKRICTVWYWIVAIIVATTIVILMHMK